ncbi:hypothetical protein BDC45DRAFT_523259 [Circinella umbellata]|nr:hypothetical protein BDC45DRAFT_523259 [Circinella umbellata]
MSDFWVSQQRHWCKYCKKFIANNKPSIEIHNNGRQHKDAVDKFLRDVYKGGQQKKEEDEKKLKELERIEKAAMKTMGNEYQGSDLSSKYSISNYAKSLSSSSYSSKSKTTFEPPPPKDDDIQQKQLEGKEEWAIPSNIAAPGQWEIISTIKKKATSTMDNDKKDKKTTTHDNKPEFQDDEIEDEEDLKNFKIQEKQLPLDHDNNNSIDEQPLFKKRKKTGMGQNDKKVKRRIRSKEEE